MRRRGQLFEQLVRPCVNRLGPAPAENCVRHFKRCRTAFIGVGVFSGLINILALTGSLYMLQVYDRVLTSRSVPTLVGLTVLMLVLYALFGCSTSCAAG